MNIGKKIEVLDVTPPGFGEKLIASYLINTERIVLVETGPISALQNLLNLLKEKNIKPELVVVTHIHLDHAGAAGALARRINAKILVHPRGAKHLVSPSKLWKASKSVLGPIAEVYGEPEPAPESLVEPAPDGLIVDLGDDRLKIIHTPGHASHHMSILLEGEGLLFTGDSAGVSIESGDKRVRIPTTPPPFRPELYIESLDRMMSFEPKRIVPTHYGIDPLDGMKYLVQHKESVTRWVNSIGELVSNGVTDPLLVAEKLPDVLEDARVIAGMGNPIIQETFYKSTVWGMVDYWVRKLGKTS